jgi:hypothetical protein
VADSDQPEICPIRSVMQLVLCARRLNQPDDMPIALYKTKKGKVIYLTGNKMPSFSGRPSKRYVLTLLQTNSSGILLMPCGFGHVYCLMRPESPQNISRRGSAGWEIPLGCT